MRTRDLGVRRLAEQAEARVVEADDIVRALHRTGRVRPAVILGPVMGVRPYDPKRPVVCIDEQPIQLIAETRTPIPA